MSNPTSVSDVEARFRTLTSEETAVAQTLIADAWDVLTTRIPSLEDNVTAGTVTTSNVRRVVANMVVRVLRNPDGLLEERIDDYSYRRDAILSSGVLHVTADEVADLLPGRRRSRSIRLTNYGDE